MNTSKVKRYKPGTPVWLIMMDYYEQVARDAEALGKKLKAARFRRKAKKVFLNAGGMILEI